MSYASSLPTIVDWDAIVPLAATASLLTHAFIHSMMLARYRYTRARTSCEETEASGQLHYTTVVITGSTVVLTCCKGDGQSQWKTFQSATGSALQQINRHLEMDNDDDDCLAFWRRNRVNLNKLVYPAIRALSVPAASSAVESVFSHGGVILRSHLG